ncbi:MAG TPA: hypothetical protein VFE19_08810 [Jatrophihabitantaceae bacterium]|nr:hypothetical protein [Jatrophihabitantaceae bacterium]
MAEGLAGGIEDGWLEFDCGGAMGTVEGTVEGSGAGDGELLVAVHAHTARPKAAIARRPFTTRDATARPLPGGQGRIVPSGYR